MQRLLERFCQLVGFSCGGSPTATSESLPTSRAVFEAGDMGDWYHPVMLGPGTLGELALRTETLREVLRIVGQLSDDDYVRYLSAYYRTGLDRFGDHWRYADICTVLLAAARLLQPREYLEIGVRRGRSMAMVAAAAPNCNIVGFDLWMGDYAGIPNPGPGFVRSEMVKAGHKGRINLIQGDSHRTVPDFLSQNPEAYFDIITVDGDHLEEGAAQDLLAVIPRLKIGGVLVFDDIVHPLHRYLMDVWNRTIRNDRRLAAWEFTELGCGVALALRRDP